MGQKGPKMQIDIPSLEAVIVGAGRLRNECQQRANTIRQICNSMETDETLVGGEGDTIRECFQDIAAGVTNIENSIDYAIRNLNTALEKAIKLQKSRMSGSLAEDTKSATNKAGVFKKN